MCGIIFIHRADAHPAAKMVLKRYEAQKYRGRLGYGYVSINREGFLNDYIRAALETDILREIKTDKSPTIMFHHRMPTSTPNFAEAAHPIKVSNESLENDFYVIHNGVISNAYLLKIGHEKAGFSYNTEIAQEYKTKSGRQYGGESVFNDSEALAIEVAQYISGKKATIDTKGSVAFIAIEARKADGKAIKVHYGRNTGSPLKVIRKNFFISITSEGEGEMATFDTVYSLDLRTGTEESKPCEIGNRYTQGAGYHYKAPRDIPDVDAWVDDHRAHNPSWYKEWTFKNGKYVPVRSLPGEQAKLPILDVPSPIMFLPKREDGPVPYPEDELADLYEEEANLIDLVAYGKEQNLFDETVLYETRLTEVEKEIDRIQKSLQEEANKS